MLWGTIKAIYRNPRWGYYTTSLQFMTRVNVIIWTREQGIGMCSGVEAFFLFLLGSAASRRLFCDIRARTVMPPRKQNLSDWRGMGS